MTSYTRSRFAAAAASCCALGAVAVDPAAAATDALGAASDTLAAAFAAVLSVVFAAPLGLALGRLRFRGRALAFAILVFASATPAALLEGATAPLGESFARTLALGIPLAAWIIFLIARDWTPHIEDAARLDGVGPWHIWIPLLRRTAAATAVFVFLYGVFDLS